jgi:acyl dehydratase
MARYFEDFHIGEQFRSSDYPVSESEIIAFARQFDPQAFHTDPLEARKTIFGGLVASGWHTGAITMRLIVGSGLDIAGGIVGLGVEEMNFRKPVRPGDALHVVNEVLGLRPSRSRPDQGLMTIGTSTINQNGEAVLSMRSTVLASRKPR